MQYLLYNYIAHLIFRYLCNFKINLNYKDHSLNIKYVSVTTF